MFVKRLLQKVSVDLPIPTGNLREDQLKLQLAVHHGIPYTASVLAYEPVQRLLAVSASDGRTKILGAAGVEALLQSPTHFPCKFLEFMNNRGLLVHVNTQNDVEVWDFDKMELVYFQKWEAEITSFNVLQGSPFAFVGDQSGAVRVLEYVDEDNQLNIMPYVIPAHITLGGLVRLGSSDAPSVVGILPQPDVYYTRLLVAFGNGLIILWGLHENQVLAVRGGTEDQQERLANFKGRAIPDPSKHQTSDEEEDDKEICSLCWVCPVGSVLAVGYTDGEILLWSFPTIISGSGHMEAEFVEGSVYSREPLHRLNLAPGKAKMPVVGLAWNASKPSRGVDGRLYAFGGREVGQPEALTVLSLDSLDRQETGEKLLEWELSLPDPFADMALLPEPGGSLTTPAAALALLLTPGRLHLFDGLSIANYFAAFAEDTPSPSVPQPVPLQLPVTERKVTCAQLVLLSNDGMAAKVLLQLPRSSKSSAPSTLRAGTKWPISGGAVASTSYGRGEDNVYITGHENGLVNIWDASSQYYRHICAVECEVKGDRGENCEVSTLEFCDLSGMLAVGTKNGTVFLYSLQKEGGQTICYTVSQDSITKEEVLESAAGFACILIEDVHKAAIRAISIACVPARLAVGDESGKVSIVNLDNNSVLFCESCFQSPILSAGFSSEPMSSDGTPIVLSPRSPSIKRKSPPVPVGRAAVLYIVGKDASMVAIDASSGALFGPGPMQPKHPLTAISLHLLEAGGAPVSVLNLQPDEVLDTGGLSDQDSISGPVATSVTDEAAESSSVEEQTSGIQGCTKGSEATFLLLCCMDSLRLYAASAIIQRLRKTLHVVKLDRTCCWTSTCSTKGSRASGLVLMYDSGDIEVRSLPDLGLLKQSSLSLILNWKAEPSLHSQSVMASNVNGQLVVIDHDSEIIHVSFLEDDHTRDQLPLPRLYDKDVAKAADFAISYSRGLSKKKLSTHAGMQGLIGGVIKELKTALDIDQRVAHRASELPKLFNSCPYNVPAQSSSPSRLDASGSSKDNTLDIDDIDIDYTEVDSSHAAQAPQAPEAPPVEARKASTLGNKLSGAIMKGLKGKERNDEAESDRMKLFEGKDEPKPTKAQTVDDIRAKYGHPRKSQEISGAMDQARQKLAERGEKLQDISDKTADLENNAENFASMAEELARRVSRKKWWEL